VYVRTYSHGPPNIEAECCSVLQCVAVCQSVLQYDAVCCSVLQCVTVCYSVYVLAYSQDQPNLCLNRHGSPWGYLYVCACVCALHVCAYVCVRVCMCVCIRVYAKY